KGGNGEWGKEQPGQEEEKYCGSPGVPIQRPEKCNEKCGPVPTRKCRACPQVFGKARDVILCVLANKGAPEQFIWGSGFCERGTDRTRDRCVWRFRGDGGSTMNAEVRVQRHRL